MIYERDIDESFRHNFNLNPTIYDLQDTRRKRRYDLSYGKNGYFCHDGRREKCPINLLSQYRIWISPWTEKDPTESERSTWTERFSWDETWKQSKTEDDDKLRIKFSDRLQMKWIVMINDVFVSPHRWIVFSVVLMIHRSNFYLFNLSILLFSHLHHDENKNGFLITSHGIIFSLWWQVRHFHGFVFVFWKKMPREIFVMLLTKMILCVHMISFSDFFIWLNPQNVWMKWVIQK